MLSSSDGIWLLNAMVCTQAGKTAADLAKNKDLQQLLADAVAARQSQSKPESAEPVDASTGPPAVQAEASIGSAGPPDTRDAEASGAAASAADTPVGAGRKRNMRQQARGDSGADEPVENEEEPPIGPAIGPPQQPGAAADHALEGGEPAAKKQKPAAPTLSHLGDEEDE